MGRTDNYEKEAEDKCRDCVNRYGFLKGGVNLCQSCVHAPVAEDIAKEARG